YMISSSVLKEYDRYGIPQAIVDMCIYMISSSVLKEYDRYGIPQAIVDMCMTCPGRRLLGWESALNKRTCPGRRLLGWESALNKRYVVV
nr:hypothetical protein [Tanacetum cinerariifolium]